jgi:hypothetical protein
MHYASRDDVQLRTDVRWGDTQAIDFVIAPFLTGVQTRQLVNVLAEHSQAWAWTVGISGLVLGAGADTLIGSIIQINQGAGSTLLERQLLRAPPAMLNATNGYAEETGVAIGNALTMRVLVVLASAAPIGTPRTLAITAQIAPISVAAGAIPAGFV